MKRNVKKEPNWDRLAVICFGIAAGIYILGIVTGWSILCAVAALIGLPVFFFPFNKPQ